MLWELYFFKDKSTDEFSVYSDEFQNNVTALTSQFKIIPSWIDGNYLFYTLNNIDFGGQLKTKSIRDEICDFLHKKEIYKHIWEGDLDSLLIGMRREGYWDTHLEMLAFSDLLRLNINI